MINAKTAREVTNRVIAERQNPWRQLELAIEEAMNNGIGHVTFTTKPGMEFKEHRKEVKAKLEAEGFNVEYRKYNNNDYEFGNIYTIYW